MPDDTPRSWSLLTRLVHDGERQPAPTATPTATPIYTSSTYVYDSAAELDQAFASGAGYVYARYGNPTVAALEQVMATAEAGIGAVACASGMAALHAALLAAGTPRGATSPRPRGILAARDLYGTTTSLLNDFFAAQGVPVAYCDMCDLGTFEETLQSVQPDVVLIEQISNPLLHVADVAAIAQRTHAAGARLVVDSTMTTPILQRPLTLGADIVVHSATKFLGGHGDVTAGVAVARTSLMRDLLQRYVKLLGPIIGPFEAQMLLRGIKTLALRVRQQCGNALRVAQWLEEQPEVARVHYPGLRSHAQHELAAQAFGGLFGAMVAFELHAPHRAAMFRFVDALRLILPATSLGDIYSLISLPVISSHRDLTPEQLAERHIGDNLVRMSVGIEAVEDIITDLRGALDTL
ncbi:MAG TPA: PLP-dependent aspartate aminotransferase family protein [Roseiflexaceae bacterium]|nr:PLP-dependent aspartate aminotransferase family protein [Roseiflexaceae bacterium]